MGVLSRLGLGLAKTREGLLGAIRRLLPGSRKITPELCEELEAALLSADVGAASVSVLMEAVRESVRQAGEADASSVRAVLKKVMTERLRAGKQAEPVTAVPHVILLLGVNGVGKTTTAGKLAGQFVKAGKRVVLVAGDTFRAAAGEQLEIWGRRVGADVIRHQAGGDPAAVAYDGVVAALARKADIVLVDTAGRLHTKSNLMEELRKVKRTLGKALPGAPHDVLLVLDATVGQNGLAQARQFHEAIGVTGVVLAKLDGTARGGIVLSIAGDLGLPVRYVGVGEGVGDLQAFDPEAFVEALLGEPEES
ncbi:MAG: signal recognition particle-docking protein FtsY [Nitrospirales bacterium]|nr:signal recognition particle-docking protein FtsY [Nitrospirales bacterium]